MRAFESHTNVKAFLQSASLAKSSCDDGNLALVAKGAFELLQKKVLTLRTNIPSANKLPMSTYLVFERVSPEEGLAALAGESVEVIPESLVAAHRAQLAALAAARDTGVL